MKFFIFAAVFLLLPSVFAVNCDLTNDPTYCEVIKDSDLNESEKDEIFSSLLYSDSEFPNHEFIEDYNLDITVDSPPEDTPVYNSRQIRNAWMSFLAVFPSVIEEGILFVSPKTYALSEYDYDVYVPPNYISSGYPKTSQGDCKRTYSLVQNDATLKYYLNNFYRGSEKLALVNTNSDGELKSELKINTKLKIKHYHWYSYCCSWYKGSCRKRCHKCKYDSTSYEPDSVTISEKKDIQVYTTRPL
ncbi:MAG: hypothetical protein U9P44_02485, partial [archaeon]|nr:hypothetical protein [archaeon]